MEYKVPVCRYIFRH